MLVARVVWDFSEAVSHVNTEHSAYIWSGLDAVWLGEDVTGRLFHQLVSLSPCECECVCVCGVCVCES